MSVTENCILRMAHIMRISIWRRKKKAKEDEEEEKCQENRSSGCHKCFLGPSEKQNLNTTVSPCTTLNSLSGNQQNVIFVFYL